MESRLPSSWKEADIVPVPKQKPVNDINKYLRPISLTPVLSKVAEEYVVEYFLKHSVLKKKADPNQFGTLPGLNTTYALISMLHKWNGDTDGNSAVRMVLFYFKKAFDLIDHHILIQKLISYEIPNSVIN